MPRKFKGPLAQRIEPRRIYNYLMPEGMTDPIFQSWAKEDFSKLLLLCTEYEVATDDDMYMNLCLALARDFIPGFQEKQKAGRKTKWTFSHDNVLLIDIETLIAERSCSASKAAELLADMEPWKSFLSARDKIAPDPNPGESLRRRYSRVKNSKSAEPIRKSYAYTIEIGEIDEWQSERLELFGRE